MSKAPQRSGLVQVPGVVEDRGPDAISTQAL